jgi:hypothetical protein
MKKHHLLYIISMLMLFTSSCSGMAEESVSPSLTPETVQSQTETPSAYPFPERYTPPTLSYPLPPEDVPAIANVPFSIPTPGDESGVVLGQLINIDTNEYLSGQSVYLGKKIYGTPGPGYTLGVQEMSSPHTISNEEGLFAIGDVEPGAYVIMVWTPFDTYIIPDPSSNLELEVMVNAGETIDLGILKAKNPLTNP